MFQNQENGLVILLEGFTGLQTVSNKYLGTGYQMEKERISLKRLSKITSVTKQTFRFLPAMATGY
jgi:hypothetical protein